MTQPKPQPKSAATVKKNAAKDGKGGAAAGKSGKKGRGRVSRPKKTAEELDLEMADYFENRNENNANTAAPAATTEGAAAGGDAAMEEDVL